MIRRALAGSALLGAIAVVAFGYEANLSYAEGIAELTGACFIRGIKLDAEPQSGVDWTDAKGDALYGTLPLAEGRHAVMLDWIAEWVELYVDADRTGRLTRFEWDRMLADGSLLASVPLELVFQDGATAPYRLFVMWSPFTPTVLTYCRDTYREGKIGLGTRAYDLIVIDEDSDGRYDRLDGGILLIDVDGDGHLLASSDSHERFHLDAPFNLDGAVYRVTSVAADGSRVRIESSDEDVQPKPPLLVGFPAPSFEAADAEGEPFSIEKLRGRIVVMDFWAGWCDPCIAELPTLRAIGEAYGDSEIVIVGINLDRSLAAFEEALDEHGIDYRQVYDGPDGPINTLYRIEGIPMTYVLDADGIIRGRGLRGEELLETVAALLQEEADGNEPTDP